MLAGVIVFAHYMYATDAISNTALCRSSYTVVQERSFRLNANAVVISLIF